MVNLLFNPQGRIASGPFWQGYVILIVIGFVIGAVQTFAAPPALSPLLVVLSLALIYPMVCVYGKRFHDAGKSAWWFLAVIGAQLIVGVILGIVLAARVMSDPHAAAPGSPEWQAMQTEIARKNFLPLQAIGLLVSVAIAFFVSRLPSDPGQNRFGPPTTPAAG